jgi:hypothetical protein
MAREAYIPPPPRADQTFGNVDVTHVRKIDGRSLKAKKDQEQLNTKVRSGFGDEIDGVRRQLEAQLRRDIPRGEMLEMMLAVFVSGDKDGAMKEALVALKAPTPSADDMANERRQAMTFFATRPMETALRERMQTMGWTLGGVIEDLLVKASRAVQMGEAARKG